MFPVSVKFEYEVTPQVFDIAQRVEEELIPVVDVIAFMLRDTWKEKALSTRSFRTGAYWRSIDVVRRNWLDGVERIWEIEAGVRHATIVELYLNPVAGYESLDGKRRPAQLAINAVMNGPDVTRMTLRALENATQ